MIRDFAREGKSLSSVKMLPHPGKVVVLFLAAHLDFSPPSGSQSQEEEALYTIHRGI